ncbi:hypothetical protein [Microbacterium mcarthurae (nom. nud.)]|uniref:Uncharacterized protein n=1 Tax=Microbacterium mcarthurae TaxID=3035918 RepID=A0ABW9GCB2_9MICO
MFADRLERERRHLLQLVYVAARSGQQQPLDREDALSMSDREELPVTAHPRVQEADADLE